MTKSYADNEFYKETYLTGRPAAIPDDEFDHWSLMATSRIRELTFGSVDKLSEIPEAVGMCCCEVAEKLHSFEAAKGENGLILQSYGNDGDTGTYWTEDLTRTAVADETRSITERWLSHTGLMYCGVC